MKHLSDQELIDLHRVTSEEWHRCCDAINGFCIIERKVIEEVLDNYTQSSLEIIKRNRSVRAEGDA